MVRKARSCSGGMPEEESKLTADTIQSGHLEGEPGAMRSASDVWLSKRREQLSLSINLNHFCEKIDSSARPGISLTDGQVMPILILMVLLISYSSSSSSPYSSFLFVLALVLSISILIFLLVELVAIIQQASKSNSTFSESLLLV